MMVAGHHHRACRRRRISLAPIPLPALSVSRWAFASGDQPWTAIECTDFPLLEFYQHGIDITPILQQRRDVGFNLLRVWTAYEAGTGIGVFTDIDYAKVAPFVVLCAAYGLYVEFTAYTGFNDPAHWGNLCAAALRCSTLPLLELVNELDQNTNEPDSRGRVFDVSLFTPAPAPLLSAHGSNGSQNTPVRPAWTHETFHTNDAPEWWRKNGHNAMEMSDGADGLVGSRVPILTNESTRSADRDSNPRHYYDAAASAALLCAGSCFHSATGKRSGLWNGVELECAQAHVAGAKSVDLSCQGGRYVHRGDLETAADLRVYQRLLPDGTAFTVEVRK